MGITITETRVQDQSSSALNIKDIINIVYPVGSIYMSVNSTSPASLFGGTWERIKDRFLLASGDAYKAGSTGGEATHTLTINEMPAHEHTVKVRIQGYDGWDNYTSKGYGVMFKSGQDAIGYHGPNYTAHSAVVTADSNTGNSGGSKPHNNMPPYQAVYMWKRVA